MGRKTALTATPAQLVMNPGWSPDGDRIAYDDAMDGAFICSLSGIARSERMIA
jgi:Tol biopolymer transport system component